MGDLSRAWKYSAKIYRDFYNLTMTQAKEWKGRYYKSQKENQRLREENAEKEACIQEDFHTLKGLENTLEEQGKTIERLRGLLAGMLYELSFCPICATDLIEDNTYISLPHADDCRLMKELSDG